MYCNLSKSHTFPLIFRVSRGPKSSIPQRSSFLNISRLFSNGFSSKTLEKVSRAEPRETLSWIEHHENTRNHETEKPMVCKAGHYSWKDAENNYFSKNGKNPSKDSARTRSRFINSEENKKTDYTKRARINEAGERKGEASHSSWEDAANNYFTKNVEGPETKMARTKPGFMGSRKNSRTGCMKSVRTEEEEDIDEEESEEEEDAEEEYEEEEGDGVERVEDPRWVKIKDRYKRTIDKERGFERLEVSRWKREENWGKKMWKEVTNSSPPKLIGEGVYGIGPVLAAISVGRRDFYTLYVQEGLDISSSNKKKKDKKGIEKVLKIAERISLTVKEASKHDLNMIVDNRPHQGLVLDASPLEMVGTREMEPVSINGNNGVFWVALDEVTDPQNLGAIIRSAYFFGAAGVVLCAKNSAPLSGVVSKASAGSLEIIELRSCKNMMQFLTSSVENGWRVLGGSLSKNAVPLNEVEAGEPTILVLGSEGKGLRPLVERSCTQLIRIGGNIHSGVFNDEDEGDGGVTMEQACGERMDQGGYTKELQSFLAVESLNVSVAAGIYTSPFIIRCARPKGGAFVRGQKKEPFSSYPHRNRPTALSNYPI
ncbi:hypothetical protein AMTRI_Chr12g267720 [Amborella trichopoda]